MQVSTDDDVALAESPLGASGPIVPLNYDAPTPTCVSGQCPQTYPTPGTIKTYDLSDDGSKLAVYAENYNASREAVVIDDFASGARSAVGLTMLPYLNGLGLSGDGRYAVAIDGGNVIRIDTTDWTRLVVGTVVGDPVYLGAVTISADGTVIAWKTEGAIDPADTNGAQDLYVYDSKTGLTERATFTMAGAQIIAQPKLGSLHLSADGRLVGWSGKNQPTQVPGESVDGAYLYDRTTKVTTCVHADPAGTCYSSTNLLGLNAISSDGRFALMSHYGGTRLPVLYDRTTRAAIRLPMKQQLYGDDPNATYNSGGTMNADVRVASLSSNRTDMGLYNPQTKFVLYAQDLMTHVIVPLSHDASSPAVPSADAAGGMWAADASRTVFSIGGVVHTREYATEAPKPSVAVVNYHETYTLRRYGNIGAVTGKFLFAFSGNTVLRIDGTGTMPSSYGGTDTIKIALRRLLNGSVSGFVTIAGTTPCTATLKLSEYHRCTPAGDRYDTNAEGIHVATYKTDLKAAAMTKIGTNEILIAFQYVVGNPEIGDFGKPYGLRMSLTGGASTTFNPADKVVLQSGLDDRYMLCGASSVTAKGTTASSSGVLLTMAKSSGTGAPVVGDTVTLKCPNGTYIARSGSSGVILVGTVGASARWKLESTNQGVGSSIKYGSTILRFVSDLGTRIKSVAGLLEIHSGTGGHSNWTPTVKAVPDPGGYGGDPWD